MAEGNRSIHPKALPNYRKAVIARKKLEKYVLDPTSESGRNKARVFKSALGFDQSDWKRLAQIILNELPYYEAEPQLEDEYGKRYTVVLKLTGLDGSLYDVITGWIYDADKNYPRFTTARVITKR